ncbi:long-chain fatty acid--CoA ligase [Mycobacterium sp. 852014-52144_SCH5372336]|uniref:acyl-CoA synthetase n=1 Tax=Mycobacterium sp. 852014-52144_SCH5372336 TaxID=1834115 RepID=UPI000800DB69|nr:long-chain fatty acid--CoA ligase [Mycobacterium sp. 852014-52144_SCH5372336]OBB75889.1 fatty-acid--CoA ligase [Mycobacterium sp. 852014-52144_SCH5372336]
MHITQGLHRAAQARPHQIATVFGDRARTFCEQHDRVARLAAGLRALGITDGDRVAILALNSDRYSEYLLAVPWAGAAVNPVNIRWNPNEMAYALDDSGTRCLFVDDTFAETADWLQQNCPDLTTLVYCGDGSTPAGFVSHEDLITEHAPTPDARRSADDLAGLFYTGGTTGFPKGVMLSQRNMMTSALGTVATGQLLGEGSVLLHAAPMFHLADLAAWAGQVVMGGSHVMVAAFEPGAVFAAIADHEVTDVLLVPTMIQMLVDDPRLGDYDLSSLRRILYGGSPISEGLLHRVMQVLPEVQLTQAYGMTEVAPVATLLFPDDHVGEHLGSAGRAAPHAEIQVIDDTGCAVPPGVVGQICVRGDHVMLGYWERPEETSAVLVEGWYRTGDGGYLDEDGFLFVVDRIKDMIVTGGENVYSAEVENALSTHTLVAASAVIGLPSERWGETVHACVLPVPGADVDIDELQDHVRSRLANYKVPRSIELVSELPLSGAGKVLKRQLREQILGSRR